VHIYTAIYREMVESVQADYHYSQQSDAHEGFIEQKRRKRSFSDVQAKRPKKIAMPTTGAMDHWIQSQLKLPTRNLFAPLRTTDLELEPTEDNRDRTDGDQQQPPSSQRGRPPPIMLILVYAINLIQLQKQLKGLVKGSFEFRNTRNGTRVVINEMSDFSVIRRYFKSQNKQFYLLS
jgi:hypothetical protein